MENSFSNIVGGKWWKVDFHLHTPGSYDYGHGDTTLQSTTPERFLQYCMTKELDCIVVTDHDTFQWFPKLRDEIIKMRAENSVDFREITVFPGIEINAQGNVHLLGIFDPSADYEDLVGLIALIGINKNNRTTDKALNEVMDIIIKHGGIAIPAHVDGPSGLFGEIAALPSPENITGLNSGTAPSIIKSALGVSGLLALEVLGNEFHNGLYNETKLNLAYILGSDSHIPASIGDKFTWVKMGKPNIEALRLALYDAKDSTIRSSNTFTNPNDVTGRTFIRALTIDHAKYIGRNTAYSVQFSPWLNGLIGGRGSGKSTILKFLRLILDRKDELSGELKNEFDSFAKISSFRGELGMLLNDTTVYLDMVVDGVEHQLRWMNGEISEFTNGEYSTATAVTERFPVRIFSQKQLFEMTKNPKLLFDYLDAEWDSLTWQTTIQQTQTKYKQCCQKIRSLNEKQTTQTRLKTELRDVAAKIKVFETERTKVILEQSKQLSNCKSLVNTTYAVYSPLIDCAKTLSQLNLPGDDGDLSILDDTSRTAITAWTQKMREFKIELDMILEKFAQECVPIDLLLTRLMLHKLITANASEMEHILHELRDAGIDNIDRYAELINNQTRIETQLEQYSSIHQELNEQQTIANKLLKTIDTLIKERHEERKKIITRWNSIGNLHLTLHLFGNIDHNEQTFRKIIRRDSGFELDILLRNSDTEIPEGGFLYTACVPTESDTIDTIIARLNEEKKKLIEFDGNYSRKFINYLSKVMESFGDTVDDITLWIPEDSLNLEIRVNNRLQPVDAGSPGQKTSAVLSLIFGISNVPIIIDQPEDDLDTRNITDIVVEGINQLKSKQQIILVTHNPNIVVNTNSEQIVQLDFVNGQIINACSGALQNHNVRDAICEVMEGGKDALEKRYYRIFKALESTR